MASKTLLNSVILFLFFTGGYGLVTINFQNYCSQRLWLAASPEPSHPNWGRVIGPNGDVEKFIIEDPWTGSIWARTKCTDNLGKLSCETGDCGSGSVYCKNSLPTSPTATTLLNFGINKNVVSYEISLIHGHNVAVRIEPVGGRSVGGKSASCAVADCAQDISNVCPSYLVAQNKDGAYVGCRSACDALNKCCTQPCKETQLFKNLCSAAHTYKGDGPFNKCNGATSYNVTFCPV